MNREFVEDLPSSFSKDSHFSQRLLFLRILRDIFAQFCHQALYLVMNSPIDKNSGYDVADTISVDRAVSASDKRETEVFATDSDGINFRTVGWIRGEFPIESS